jgi:hypothetical protein
MPLENKKLSDKPLVNTFTDKAVVHILEPEDFSQSPTGSDYRIKLENVIGQVNDSFVPLSGTEVGKPITGDLEFQGEKFLIANGIDGKYSSLILSDDGSVTMQNNDGTFQQNFGSTSELLGFLIASDNPDSRGLMSNQDFSTNITDFDYVQKIYVDNLMSGGGGGGTAENRQQFTTYGNKYNLSTIGNFYSSEVELGLTPTTINNSPGNNLTAVMATRWVMPLFNSDKSQKLKRFVIRTTDVNFTSFRVVIFMGQTLNGSASRINNFVIHDENITLSGSGNTSVIERTSFTNDVTIPAGYEVCYLISRLNGTNGTINNFQISGYAS